MLESIVGALVTLAVGYVVDRWGYNRSIDRAARRIAPSLPDATAREIANQAIIEANRAEAERAMRMLKERSKSGPLSSTLK